MQSVWGGWLVLLCHVRSFISLFCSVRLCVCVLLPSFYLSTFGLCLIKLPTSLPWVSSSRINPMQILSSTWTEETYVWVCVFCVMWCKSEEGEGGGWLVCCGSLFHWKIIWRASKGTDSLSLESRCPHWRLTVLRPTSHKNTVSPWEGEIQISLFVSPCCSATERQPLWSSQKKKRNEDGLTINVQLCDLINSMFSLCLGFLPAGLV